MQTIIILALVFLFVGLRLYSVLGRRTGHEQPIAKPTDRVVPVPANPAASQQRAPAPAAAADGAVAPAARDGVRAIAAADAQFDPVRFLGGAQSAYRMILEAFWKGDEDELAPLVDPHVRSSFGQAIADRKEAGHVLDNRLVTIERAIIESASLGGRTARVAVRFDADIAAVTRDRDGVVVAGSMTDAVETHDVWTFSRQTDAADLNWILTETDEAA